jgi:hypothetical protein
MPLDELTELQASTTTRRTIVRTGAKLAYAAPLVAATMKLGAEGAGAQVQASPVCRPGASCTSVGELVPCDGSNCFCVRTFSGSSACVENVFGSGACPDTGQCPDGEVCIPDTCFGDLCLPLCSGSDSLLPPENGPLTAPDSK